MMYGHPLIPPGRTGVEFLTQVSPRSDDLRTDMKLWVDDVRVAPPGWMWARTNEEAKLILKSGKVVECSLDHDMGLDYVDALDYASKPEELWILRGDGANGDGRDLVRWMIAEILVPELITIHSWNPDGAKEMARLFNDAGYSCTIRPASR